MQLKDQVKCRLWSDCDIGKRAGQDRTVFPQEFLGPAGNTAAMGRWTVFNKPNGGQGHGNRQNWTICMDHHELLKQDWEEGARDEVRVTELTNQYEDRGLWW